MHSQHPLLVQRHQKDGTLSDVFPVLLCYEPITSLWVVLISLIFYVHSTFSITGAVPDASSHKCSDLQQEGMKTDAREQCCKGEKVKLQRTIYGCKSCGVHLCPVGVLVYFMLNLYQTCKLSRLIEFIVSYTIIAI